MLGSQRKKPPKQREKYYHDPFPKREELPKPKPKLELSRLINSRNLLSLEDYKRLLFLINQLPENTMKFYKIQNPLTEKEYAELWNLINLKIISHEDYNYKRLLLLINLLSEVKQKQAMEYYRIKNPLTEVEKKELSDLINSTNLLSPEDNTRLLFLINRLPEDENEETMYNYKRKNPLTEDEYAELWNLINSTNLLSPEDYKRLLKLINRLSEVKQKQAMEYYNKIKKPLTEDEYAELLKLINSTNLLSPEVNMHLLFLINRLPEVKQKQAMEYYNKIKNPLPEVEKNKELLKLINSTNLLSPKENTRLLFLINRLPEEKKEKKMKDYKIKNPLTEDEYATLLYLINLKIRRPEKYDNKRLSVLINKLPKDKQKQVIDYEKKAILELINKLLPPKLIPQANMRLLLLINQLPEDEKNKVMEIYKKQNPLTEKEYAKLWRLINLETELSPEENKDLLDLIRKFSGDKFAKAMELYKDNTDKAFKKLLRSNSELDSMMKRVMKSLDKSYESSKRRDSGAEVSSSSKRINAPDAPDRRYFQVSRTASNDMETDVGMGPTGPVPGHNATGPVGHATGPVVPPGPDDMQINGGNNPSKPKHIYKGRAYTIYTGTKGGKYINVNGKKVYIYI